MVTPRHRRRLNRAVHELRRPLQVLALLEGADGPGRNGREAARRGLLELARCALAELEGELNGSDLPPRARRQVSGRELLEAALERWRAPAELAGGIRVYWDAGAAPVLCDPARLSQALDNLLANAIDHGGRPRVVTGASVAGRLRITVANGPGPGGARPGLGDPAAAPGDPRRGHGVELVTAVATELSGRFALCRTGSGCVAAFEVPLCDQGLALAA